MPLGQRRAWIEIPCDFAGIVRCQRIETGVKSTNICLLGQHVGQHIANTTQKAVGRGTTRVGPTFHLLTWRRCVGGILEVSMST